MAKSKRVRASEARKIAEARKAAKKQERATLGKATSPRSVKVGKKVVLNTKKSRKK